MKYYDICNKVPTKTCRVFCMMATIFPEQLSRKGMREMYESVFGEEITISSLATCLKALNKKGMLMQCFGQEWAANLFIGATPEHYEGKFRKDPRGGVIYY